MFSIHLFFGSWLCLWGQCKMGLTSLTTSTAGSWHLYICDLLGHSAIFVTLQFTCVHEGHFMICNKEEFQLELSRKIVLLPSFIGHKSAWFVLLSACCLVEFNSTNLFLRDQTWNLPQTCCFLAVYIVRRNSSPYKACEAGWNAFSINNFQCVRARK